MSIKLKQNTEQYGVLLVNLGTPDQPEPAAIRRYLTEFLGDKRVIDYPRWFWYPILYGVILPIRSVKVASAYRAIWWKNGSPLRVISERQTVALKQELADLGIKIEVELAMTYGNPSMTNAMKKLTDKGVDKIVVLPLYPQNSSTTTAAVFDVVANTMKQYKQLPQLRFVPEYYRETSYRSALANSVKAFWQQHGRHEHILCSFHGIPARYVKNGDPYQAHCEGTRAFLAEDLQLNKQQLLMSYQSRVGKEEWLKPYTSEILQQLPKQGITKLDVICPAFSVDCLETLEEIEQENKEIFLQAGGEEYRYIPALNDNPEHIKMMGQLVAAQLNGW